VEQGLSPARQAAVVAGIEALAIVVFAVALGIASFDSRGTNTGASPVAEVVIYLLFALCMGLVARGLWRKSRFARTPMVLAQVFGLVSAWLLLEGDGYAVVAGVAVVAVCVAGLVLTMRPATGADLDD
jgi:peptidoglycan/LPS O-acetylase OafA/YrhL